jgi:hypothetical protein
MAVRPKRRQSPPLCRGRKTVLANNGEVVEIRALTDEGMIVCNDPGICNLMVKKVGFR